MNCVYIEPPNNQREKITDKSFKKIIVTKLIEMTDCFYIYIKKEFHFDVITLTCTLT